jgi:dUTP pyrophosphatase
MSDIMQVEVINENVDIENYGYATEHSAGIDLAVAEPTMVKNEEVTFIPTGIKIAIPEGHFGMVCSRSGHGTKRGLVVAQGVGIIDSDYRGEVFVPIYNRSCSSIFLPIGERIAQMIIVPFVQVGCAFVEKLTETERGDGGFGSTG